MNNTPDYILLLQQISDTYTQGRLQAVQAVNVHITQTYWQMGQHIVEFEQGGKTRAAYGKALISKLAQDLSLRHGKGFSRSNLVPALSALPNKSEAFSPISKMLAKVPSR